MVHRDTIIGRAEKYLDATGWAESVLATACINAVLDMVETPRGKRMVPKVVHDIEKMLQPNEPESAKDQYDVPAAPHPEMRTQSGKTARVSSASKSSSKPLPIVPSSLVPGPFPESLPKQTTAGPNEDKSAPDSGADKE